MVLVGYQKDDKAPQLEGALSVGRRLGINGGGA